MCVGFGSFKSLIDIVNYHEAPPGALKLYICPAAAAAGDDAAIQRIIFCLSSVIYACFNKKQQLDQR